MSVLKSLGVNVFESHESFAPSIPTSFVVSDVGLLGDRVQNYGVDPQKFQDWSGMLLSYGSPAEAQAVIQLLREKVGIDDMLTFNTCRVGYQRPDGSTTIETPYWYYYFRDAENKQLVEEGAASVPRRIHSKRVEDVSTRQVEKISEALQGYNHLLRMSPTSFINHITYQEIPEDVETELMMLL
jgi:hypothetical protein